jgi:hypothetical protein
MHTHTHSHTHNTLSLSSLSLALSRSLSLSHTIHTRARARSHTDKRTRVCVISIFLSFLFFFFICACPRGAGASPWRVSGEDALGGGGRVLCSALLPPSSGAWTRHGARCDGATEPWRAYVHARRSLNACSFEAATGSKYGRDGSGECTRPCRFRL